MSVIIQLKDVTKIFKSGQGSPVTALDRFSLRISGNEIISIVGPSGCGKTTILNLIAGFLRPTSGRILVDNRKPSIVRTTYGVVFQSDSVFPWMTVRENVAFGLLQNGTSEKGAEEQVRKLLELANLSDFANYWPKQLSGGMKKRVELVRAYAPNPKILLLDEPFGSLDVLTKEEMHQFLLSVWEERKTTVVFVTHDVEEAVFLGHRVVVMSPRPGSVKESFKIHFEMPRRPSLKLTTDFLEIRRRVIEALS